MKNCVVSLGMALTILNASAAIGDEVFSLDEYAYASGDGSFEFSVSAGVLALEGREHVFTSSGASNNLSLLIWQSVSPMVATEAKVTFGGGWTVNAEGRVAASGLAYMEDYDWIAPFNPSFGFDDWSHRSQHPNTNLDWFAEGSVALGYDFDLRGGMKANFNGGFAYTDVQWAASDGSFIYSNAGFRDSSGNFTGPGITYRQQLPSAFVGVDTRIEQGNFTFDVGGRVGMTVLGLATDWHWQRTPPLRFDDTLTAAPTLGARVKASYAVSDNFSVFVDGQVDKVFLVRGDTETFNINTGASTGGSADTAGAELLSGSISAGLKGSFH